MSIPFQGTYGTMYYVRDVIKTVEYYRQRLGIEPSIAGDTWAEFDFAGHALCFHRIQGDQKPIAGGVLILKVRGIREVVAVLKEKGTEFIGELQEIHPGAYSIDFIDPDGNWVSLYEHVSY